MTFFLQIATPTQCIIHEKEDQIKQTWQMGRNRNKQAGSRTKFCVAESRAILSFLEMDYKLFTDISDILGLRFVELTLFELLFTCL